MPEIITPYPVYPKGANPRQAPDDPGYGHPGGDINQWTTISYPDIPRAVLENLPNTCTPLTESEMNDTSTHLPGGSPWDWVKEDFIWFNGVAYQDIFGVIPVTPSFAVPISKTQMGVTQGFLWQYTVEVEVIYPSGRHEYRSNNLTLVYHPIHCGWGQYYRDYGSGNSIETKELDYTDDDGLYWLREYIRKGWQSWTTPPQERPLSGQKSGGLIPILTGVGLLSALAMMGGGAMVAPFSGRRPRRKS